MKTVVTGGTGFIGSNLVKRLADLGRDVVATRQRASDDSDSLSELDVEVERRCVDLTNYNEAVAAVKGAETVYHLAAMVGNAAYLHSTQLIELESLQTNLLIDANVFRACLASGVEKIVFASSCAVYAADRQLIPGAMFREDDLKLMPSFTPNVVPGEINPDGGYGWAKLAAEVQLNWVRGIGIGIARIFNVYGENEALGRKTHVIGDLSRRLVAAPEGDFTIYGDGTQTRDFIFVSDCVDALVGLEEKAADPGVTVNVGSGRPTSIGDIACKLAALSGKNINLVFDASRPHGLISRTADISRARSLLHWYPRVSLEEGLQRTYTSVRRRMGIGTS